MEYERYPYGAIGLAGFLVIWWAVVASGYVDKLYLATPQDTFTALINGLADGSLAQEILPSVQRALTGFVIGLIAGIGLGIAVGYVRIVQQFLEPVLLFFRNLSLAEQPGHIDVLVRIALAEGLHLLTYCGPPASIRHVIMGSR